MVQRSKKKKYRTAASRRVLGWLTSKSEEKTGTAGLGPTWWMGLGEWVVVAGEEEAARPPPGRGKGLCQSSAAAARKENGDEAKEKSRRLQLSTCRGAELGTSLSSLFCAVFRLIKVY